MKNAFKCDFFFLTGLTVSRRLRLGTEPRLSADSADSDSSLSTAGVLTSSCCLLVLYDTATFVGISLNSLSSLSFTGSTFG